MIILILVFCSIYFFIYKTSAEKELISAFAKSCVIFFLEIFIITEVLSLLKSFSSFWVLLSHLLFISIAFVFNQLWTTKSKIDFKEIIKKIYHLFKLVKNEPSFYLITIICCLLLVSGIIFPPNNWDSMTYHLSRIGYWIQNQSVDFFPTYNYRQLFMGPLAEYAISHSILLSKVDSFAFTLQFFSAVSSALIIAWITKKVFNAKIRVQVLATLIGLLVPMSILQSISTQNDYVSSLFTLLAIFFFIEKKEMFFFLAVSLSFLTKQSGILFILPILFFWIKQTIESKKVISLLLLSLVFFLINSLHFYRNNIFFNSPLGPSGKEYFVGTFRPNYIVVNAIKNLSLDMQSPWPTINEFISKTTVNISDILQVPINDPSISYLNEKYELTNNIFDQDYAGSFIYIIIAFIALFSTINKNKSYKQKIYLTILIVGYLSVMFLIRWQPWATRLHLTSYLLVAPIIATFISQFSFLQKLIVGSLFISGIFTIIFNVNQPLLKLNLMQNKEVLRYAKRPHLFKNYAGFIDLINKNSDKISEIGVISNGDSWEYPIWYYLYQSDRGKEIKYKPFFPELLTNKELMPDFIVDLDKTGNLTQYPIYNKYYEKVLNKNFTHIDVWRKR